MAVVLVGDVGGTNSRLQLLRIEVAFTQGTTSTLLSEERLSSQAFPSFRDVVAAFLAGKEQPLLAVVGIAGPVAENQCTITNVAHWPKIIGDSLASEFHLRQFRLMNDFEAAGYGVLDLKPEDMENININNGAREIPGKPKAVIGAGTGIGECILTAHDGEYIVWPGEGGHCDFFPKLPIEFEYSQYILYPSPSNKVHEPSSPYAHFLPIDNITVELAIGGIVLPHLYYFFQEKHRELENTEFTALFDSSYVSKENDGRGRLLFEYGLTGRDRICEMGVKLFLSILGYEAGNMATKTLCSGGLYLMGGVVQKNLEAIKREGTLLSAFYKKPKHIKSILDQVPLYLVTYDDVGLLGAVYYAKKLVAQGH